ncbi:MAG: 4-alpha-glucanotransferase, partial [Chloroflexi bacterium]|nr:4-alpha-glucanotransferase [Chloroflexota bacterium]
MRRSAAAHDQLVEPSYVDAFRERRPIAPQVRAGVLAAMGLNSGEEAEPASPPVVVAPRGSSLPAGELTLEDGTPLGRVAAVPPDVPFGYHRLQPDAGVEQLLITGPGRCHLPDLSAWGWTVQLAATRSQRSWGIGDLHDLRELGRWSASVGAGFVAASPLSAPNPGPTPEASPYYPSTRRFGNPLHLCIDALPGAGDVADLAARGRELNDERRVDRPRVIELKRAALERLWAKGSFDRAAFDAWRAGQGQPLERWAIFCILSERFGPGWKGWPEAYRHPSASAAARIAIEERERVAFHAWVQWCFDVQLADASGEVRRIADMPVGVDPAGFDAWDWQEHLAIGATVGVPPDRFNLAGQDWGMPPFAPHRLRQAGYRPFIETLRAQLRHAGGLRMDHVLGLFRLWWIPAGFDPPRGAYVRQRTDELLEIVALESQRAAAIVVGEDLGTVPAGVRAELRRRRLLSTRLALFERDPPARYPRQSFAGVTTHDLPTVAGIWTGADLADQAVSGVVPDADGLAVLRARLLAAAGLGADATLDELVVGLHRALATSPSALVVATLEDALRVERRPNLPGT